MLALLLAVAGAATTARLTRLLTADYLTEPLRRRMLQAVQEGGRLEYLLSCRWCASVWIGLGVAVVLVAALPALRPTPAIGAVAALVLGLAYSQITGERAAAEVEV